MSATGYLALGTHRLYPCDGCHEPTSRRVKCTRCRRLLCSECYRQGGHTRERPAPAVVNRFAR